MNKVRSYKLRAECPIDVTRFINQSNGNFIAFTMQKSAFGFPDVTFTFETIMSLKRIKQIITKVPDGHVMYETVSLLTKYTGKRTYSSIN